MEKKIQKKKYIFILAIAIIYLLGISVHVQAAGNRISVKVNESEKAVLEKTKNSWQLTTGDEEKDKQILSSKVLYLRIPKKKELLTGYYTFNSRGVLDTRKTIHTLDTKFGDVRFKGKYYFGEQNGRLWMNKPGWTQIKKKQYYLSKTGRICVNRWIKGYYVKEDGQIAKNMQTPDGSYVDCDGHKCTKEEMSLSSLKKQLVSMISLDIMELGLFMLKI